MTELLKSMRDSFKDRVTSPLLGTFVLSRLLWNWNIWYATLFVDQSYIIDKYGLLKDQYILYLIHYNSFRGLKIIILPLLSVFIIHWIVPFFDENIYKRHLLNKTEKEIIKLKNEQEETTKKEEILSVIVKSLKKEKELREEYKSFFEGYTEAQNNYIEQYEKYEEQYEKYSNRENEYILLKKDVLFLSVIKYLNDNQQGLIGNKIYNKKISEEEINYSIKNGLINIDSSFKKEVVFTEKSLFMLELYKKDKKMS